MLGPDGIGLCKPYQGALTLVSKGGAPKENELSENSMDEGHLTMGENGGAESIRAGRYMGDYCIEFREPQQGLWR